MSHVVMHVWRVSRAAVVPAVLRMAVDRLHLSSAPGLGFSKLLGTGDGRTFDVRVSVHDRISDSTVEEALDALSRRYDQAIVELVAARRLLTRKGPERAR